MSKFDWSILIAAIPPTLAALAALLQAVKTHKAVNSRMDELLKIAKAEAAAQATLVEKKAEHVRQGEAAVAKAAAQTNGDVVE